MNLFENKFSELFNSSNFVSLIKILLTVKTVSRTLITVTRNLFLSDMDEFCFKITYGITSKKVWSQRRNPLLTNWSFSTFGEVKFDVLTPCHLEQNIVKSTLDLIETVNNTAFEKNLYYYYLSLQYFSTSHLKWKPLLY
jgi:hypothetical protein